MLLEEVSAYTARLGHNAYRPAVRPAAGAAARAWWVYAARAVRQQLAKHKLTWGQALEASGCTRQPAPFLLLFLPQRLPARSCLGAAACLPAQPTVCTLAGASHTPTRLTRRACPASFPSCAQFTRMRERYVPMYLQYLRGQTLNAALRPVPAIVAMDRQLPEKTVLMFRRLAYAEVSPPALISGGALAYREAGASLCADAEYQMCSGGDHRFR